eukprot:TRINITY_DN10023_c0_g2_i3.p2 TRINITY_DN10023_c0_g2~~TRINITY_DN10023_c0_g2_i3.p2  ORF type:complete len:135 (+),score=7.87 TRINITY_DN10023_c0_g2_i3:542-946(+)
MGALNWPIFLRNLYTLGVTITPDLRLENVSTQADGRCVATFLNEYSGTRIERVVDTLVIEHGTAPCIDVFDDLKASSSNGGVTDFNALLARPSRPQEPSLGSTGGFLLFRVGDAVSSRNIHAALYDSLRLCKDF